MPFGPSCTTEGDTVEEALKNAKESLELALEETKPDDLECLEYSHPAHIVVGEVEVEVPGQILSPDKYGSTTSGKPV